MMRYGVVEMRCRLSVMLPLNRFGLGVKAFLSTKIAPQVNKLMW